jgi:DNA-directed RNA polymerase specialized sigma24 family protein
LWAIVGKCADLGGDVETVHELEQDAWTRVWADIDGWAAPGYGLNGRKPAKITSRLYAFARSLALGWRTARLRERTKFGDADEAARVGYDPEKPGVVFVEPKNYEEMWSQAA